MICLISVLRIPASTKSSVNRPRISGVTRDDHISHICGHGELFFLSLILNHYMIAGAIIGDGDRKRGVHAKPSKKTNVLVLAKIAPLTAS